MNRARGKVQAKSRARRRTKKAYKKRTSKKGARKPNAVFVCETYYPRPRPGLSTPT